MRTPSNLSRVAFSGTFIAKTRIIGRRAGITTASSDRSNLVRASWLFVSFGGSQLTILVSYSLYGSSSVF